MLSYPVQLKDIPKFEEKNNVNISVFHLDNKQEVQPLHITKFKFDVDVDLLLINGKNSKGEETSHYVGIKSLSRLISPQVNVNGHQKVFYNILTMMIYVVNMIFKKLLCLKIKY
eukprot:Lithocolla_globosa_v1_NODE_4011_length_1529_cov_53.116011.p2 type:complete len:114 gc:universal NODE_4011_length_1529_cov_53.116011:1082-741(-)